MDMKGFFDGLGGAVIVLCLLLVGLWKIVPVLALAGQALVRFFINLCFALLALGFFGFLAFGLVRTIFHPLFR
jgi:hypothetical protein